MIYHAMTKEGAFVCGDSVTGITSYAYPTSEHATKAKKNPVRTSLEMVEGEIGWIHATERGSSYDLLNWRMLHDTESDHTVRAIIDTVMERLIPTQQKEAS